MRKLNSFNCRSVCANFKVKLKFSIRNDESLFIIYIFLFNFKKLIDVLSNYIPNYISKQNLKNNDPDFHD